MKKPINCFGQQYAKFLLNTVCVTSVHLNFTLLEIQLFKTYNVCEHLDQIM